MLRGAIDLVHLHRIGGWIYCGPDTSAEPKVLAFLDGHCVGAGRIDEMREDLKQAGLGDGRLGFSFPIHVGDEADLGRVVVKLEGSDFALLQRDARLAKREAKASSVADPRHTEWLRRKGFLAPGEAAFLMSLHRLGAVDHSLVIPRSAARPKAEVADPLATAQDLFDLAVLRPLDLKRIDLTFVRAADLVVAVQALDGALPVVAIHARSEGGVSVVEGSHVTAVESLEGAIEYSFGPDRLLFLDLNARFEKLDGGPAALSVFVACA